jgi:hypothetical protein
MRRGDHSQVEGGREGRDGMVLVQGKLVEMERIKVARRKVEEHIRKNPEAAAFAALAFGIKI